jgi:hypothetical protein
MIEVVSEKGVIRAAEHDCEFRELGEYAAALAEEAIKLLPDCAAYSGQINYGDLGRLAVCASARGNRRAALEAESVAFGPDRHDLEKLTDPTIVANWPGQPKSVGGPAFAQMWSAVRSQSIGLHFVLDEAIGEGAQRVTMRGSFLYLANATDEPYQRAEGVETWQLLAGRWRLTRLRVGTFRPYDLTRDPRNPT